MPPFGDLISIGWVDPLAPLGERADDKAADGQDKEEPARPVSQEPHEAPACSAAVYEYGCQVPSGVCSGGANRSRRRPRAVSPSPPCTSTSPTGGARGRLAVSQALLVGWRASRFGRQARTTVSPCGTSHGPSTSYRVRLERPARPQCEPTHRTNGASTGSPGGTTAARTDHASSASAAATAPPFPPGFCAAVLDPPPRLTPAPLPPAGRAAAPWNRPAAAHPFPGRFPAAPPAPRTATTRSAACGPGPRSPPSGRACCPHRSAADTTGSRRCLAANVATARRAPRSSGARAGGPPC